MYFYGESMQRGHVFFPPLPDVNFQNHGKIKLLVIFFKKLGCGRFTMLYWFLLKDEVSQLRVYLHPFRLELLRPPLHPSRSLTSLRSCRRPPLAICVTRGGAHTSL